jgi:hypothetical protein
MIESELFASAIDSPHFDAEEEEMAGNVHAAT